MPRTGERGLALVSVLWGVAILSLIAAAMLASGYLSARMSHNAWSATQVRAAADSGIRRAILMLLDSRGGTRWRLDGTPRTVSVDGLRMTIAVQDERGRIDLNKADASVIAALLVSQGAAQDDATQLARRIVEWRTPAASDTGEPARDYRDAGYGVVPRQAPFQSVGEVQLVFGMTPSLFRRIEPALTIYSRQANVDESVAPRPVLLALNGTDAPKSSSPPPAEAASLAGHAFAITVETGAAPASRAAVIELTGDPAHPYLVRLWQ